MAERLGSGARQPGLQATPWLSHEWGELTGLYVPQFPHLSITASIFLAAAVTTEPVSPSAWSRAHTGRLAETVSETLPSRAPSRRLSPHLLAPSPSPRRPHAAPLTLSPVRALPWVWLCPHHPTGLKPPEVKDTHVTFYTPSSKCIGSIGGFLTIMLLDFRQVSKSKWEVG